MCKKKQFKYCPSEIDECMKNLVEFINNHTEWKTVACCCGHGKYSATLLVKHNTKFPYEIFSGIVVPREFKFYKKDEQGYYYIPETSSPKN